MQSASIKEQFQRAHSAHADSPVLQRIWRNAYGEDYPEGVNPSAFYSRSTLLRLRAGLRTDAGGTIVDLGCGNGGAGLWFARELGTKLIGIDLSAVGVATAFKRADCFSESPLARYRSPSRSNSAAVIHARSRLLPSGIGGPGECLVSTHRRPFRLLVSYRECSRLARNSGLGFETALSCSRCRSLIA
jgi:SAM-dependent methyltransferase